MSQSRRDISVKLLLIGFLKFLQNLKVLKTIFERLNGMAKYPDGPLLDE